MRCFCPVVANTKELINKLSEGLWDSSIEGHFRDLEELDMDLTKYYPTEFFEMQAEIENTGEFLCMQFWDKNESGVYDGFKYTLSAEQEQFFDMFVKKINNIYAKMK